MRILSMGILLFSRLRSMFNVVFAAAADDFPLGPFVIVFVIVVVVFQEGVQFAHCDLR